MPDEKPTQPESQQPSSESFGNVPHDAERFGNVPKASESFRTLPKDAEALGTLPQRTEYHTLTVREVARMFEAAGVPRSERSIVNWCRRDAQGVARLDAYPDPNERKYYITPQSVERAIEEEQAKASKTEGASESFGNTASRPAATKAPTSGEESARIVELEKEVMDLKILNKGKDFVIYRKTQERDGFFTQLLEASRKVGELETKLLAQPQEDEKRE